MWYHLKFIGTSADTVSAFVYTENMFFNTSLKKHDISLQNILLS